MCLTEYTPDKGVHFHTVFIYDANKVQKGGYKADQIGEYCRKITKEKGRYHNCHRNKYKNNGLGVLDYKDTEKRKIVDDKVIHYLLKDNDKQSISSIKSDKKDRAFTRGTLPKSKDNKGRPRG